MANPTKWYREETITVRNDEPGELSERFGPLNEEDENALHNGAMALIIVCLMTALVMGIGGHSRHTSPATESTTEYRR